MKRRSADDRRRLGLSRSRFSGVAANERQQGGEKRVAVVDWWVGGFAGWLVGGLEVVTAAAQCGRAAEGRGERRREDARETRETQASAWAQCVVRDVMRDVMRYVVRCGADIDETRERWSQRETERG